MRLNANPLLHRDEHILEVMDAATKVKVELGKPLVLAAVDQSAAGFSQALLSYTTGAAERHIQFVTRFAQRLNA